MAIEFSDGYEAITVTENHIRQLHGVLLKYSVKDQDHREECKSRSSDSPCSRRHSIGHRWTNEAIPEVNAVSQR
jgi:hypothetical protein